MRPLIVISPGWDHYNRRAATTMATVDGLKQQVEIDFLLRHDLAYRQFWDRPTMSRSIARCVILGLSFTFPMQ